MCSQENIASPKPQTRQVVNPQPEQIRTTTLMEPFGEPCKESCNEAQISQKGLKLWLPKQGLKAKSLGVLGFRV